MKKGDRVIVKGIGLGVLKEARVNFCDVEMDEYPGVSTYMIQDVEVRNDLPKKEYKIVHENDVMMIDERGVLTVKRDGLLEFPGEDGPREVKEGDVFDIKKMSEEYAKKEMSRSAPGGCDDPDCDCHKFRADRIRRNKDFKVEVRRFRPLEMDDKILKTIREKLNAHDFDEQGRSYEDKMGSWKILGLMLASLGAMLVVFELIQFIKDKV